MPDTEIHSNRVNTGRRTYFFDVEQSEFGERYLVISESTRVDSSFRRHRVLIEEEHLAEFQKGFADAIAFS